MRSYVHDRLCRSVARSLDRIELAGRIGTDVISFSPASEAAAELCEILQSGSTSKHHFPWRKSLPRKRSEPSALKRSCRSRRRIYVC